MGDNIIDLDTPNEDIVNSINDIIVSWCGVNGIEPQEISPQQWSSAMMYVNMVKYSKDANKYAKPYSNGNLKNGNISNCNAYNVDYLYTVYIAYKYICGMYQKVIRISDYINMVGVSYNYIYNTRDRDEPIAGATISSMYFYKKMKEDNESSLVGRLLDKGTNPMKVLPILNNVHGWADKKTVIEHSTERIAPKSRNDILAEFGQSAIETSEN